MKILTNKQYKKLLLKLNFYKDLSMEYPLFIETKIINNNIEMENTINNAYGFIYLHELELIKCFEEQFLKNKLNNENIYKE